MMLTRRAQCTYFGKFSLAELLLAILPSKNIAMSQRRSHRAEFRKVHNTDRHSTRIQSFQGQCASHYAVLGECYGEVAIELHLRKELVLRGRTDLERSPTKLLLAYYL